LAPTSIFCGEISPRAGVCELNERGRQDESGFTIIELMVVIAVMAIVGSLAVPSMREAMSNQRLKSQAFDVNSALDRARSEAIRSGDHLLVFFGTDALGAALQDSGGNTVPLLILNDGRPGDTNHNCLIDSGEAIEWVDPETGISIGLVGSPGNAPGDLGPGTVSTGSSFEDGGGSDASWVLFRSDGAPVGFDSSCVLGGLGSGAGAFYLENGRRTAAVTLSPTGGTKVHVHSSSWSQ
jgi:prepilin-type N-terminal cleavage/methylation domain-containing protein